MQWWAWIAVGAVLLGAELTVVDAQFYLVFVGAAALIVGVLPPVGISLALWGQWLAFTGLAIFFMLAFRRRIYEKMRANLPVMNHGPAGDTVTLPDGLAPGGTCRLEFRGSSWSAVNAGTKFIESGARARIERVDGLTLVVRADP